MRHAAYKIEVGEPFSVVINLVCFLGQLSEDDCTHSHPLDLKMTKDFLCLWKFFFSFRGFQRDMINLGIPNPLMSEAVALSREGGRDVSFDRGISSRLL